jgi:ankyrin repeat protein
MLDVPPEREMVAVCRSGHAPRVRELIEYGVRADGADGARSYLSIACEHGHDEVVAVLLRGGARATEADLILAVRSGSVPTARRIADELELTGVAYEFWAPDRPLLCDPTFLGSAGAEMVRFVLDRGADPTERDSLGRDAVANAARAGASPEVTESLRRASTRP